MAVYVYDKVRDCMVDKATGLPMLNQAERAGPLATPRTFSDTPGYQSPIDGKWVEGRRARKYDMESNNCVDANDLPSPSGGKLKNARFAKKHGAEHLLER
ncbi:hypothetical protein JQV19_08440 [Sulfitobacter mediterraneus]|uniref:hypothetical protein n=1 Tax=Sulfitobacter mediterraneus TaxID=83219 RepID=UPI00193AADF5|nr:hypothetical protein [Sulfitobacter mediterraneus]MBM1556674.1 hypothetical protein [Sulfitobacter mediterraneus]MBM1570129.1 hypothetical protein [Sulfitobacter mediterraneus]MBM1574086.1 hypothetical protein [Sulfitobacter mediterraneus]MBM1577871.1 hypothetical protein [Sulfitobacter mediterraneus]MBM1579632.1 hypothetical protein [Sulfitobacter mediterraneus]